MLNKFFLIPCGILSAIVLAGCDGLTIGTARSREQEQERQDSGPKLIEIDESDMRQPLNRDFGNIALPRPGSSPPLGSMPDLAEVERELFDGLDGVTSTGASDAGSTGRYALNYSAVELDLLNRSGARAVSDQVRAALRPAPGTDGPKSPLDYVTEIQRLSQLGVRNSPR